MIRADLDSIIFMKVGRHAGETFEEILERKQREYERTGMIFWGYGGGTMHPIQRVQPFARMRVQHGKSVSIVMEEIISRHPDTEVFATHYSRDGVSWEAIPKDIQVRGSRYALVLNELHESSLDIDLRDYQVGAGPSEGALASTYLKGRVDKGCLEKREVVDGSEASKIIRVRHAALLKDPFAVLLKSESKK
jgi:hypothetical protein